jgi:hypothetical protein
MDGYRGKVNEEHRQPKTFTEKLPENKENAE